MSKKSYTPPSLASERIFQESSKRCLFANNTSDNYNCKKHTGCDYPPTPGVCWVFPKDS